MERKREGQRGMTLVEVICSLAILGIIIAPTAAFFANSFKTNNLAREQMEANQLSQSYMEEYKSKSYFDLLNIIGDPVTWTDTPGIVPLTTLVEVQSTSTPASQIYDAVFSIGEGYSGKTLELTASDSIVKVYDGFTFAYSNTLAGHVGPIKVMIKQTGAPTNNITLNLNNLTTNNPLQVTKRSQDTKIILKPMQGEIATIVQVGEETAESLNQEAGLTITVTVSRQSDAVGLAKLRQIKMTN